MDDIKEIKQDVKILLQQSAIHNVLLAEHKNYSVALQNEQKVIKEQIKPLEKSVFILNIIFKGLGAVVIAVLIHETIHLLFK